MPDLDSLLADLAAEGDSLDGLVAACPDWSAPTPAAGWTIAHQIAHLAWTDGHATVAATDPAAFEKVLADALAGGHGFVDEGAAAGAAEPRDALLARWRDGRRAMIDALSAVPAGTRLPWFGPPMSAASMATARIMETWAHGQDVADALGAVREPTARLRHVTHIGVRTRDFAFRNRGLEPPADPFRVLLTGPGGEEWTWGPEDAVQSVSGPALDFCLLVTQRRHRADLAVTATGPDAARWLDLAQAFAGPPGPGRAPDAS
ncbi:TIGR03084 family metal-binding protein [Actinomadura viridis]|uniref:TIGR03084 family metal-binding protein n=1 Tax=Actinomadura viridis TaxID=58110 RepID=UPI00369A5EB8